MPTRGTLHWNYYLRKLVLHVIPVPQSSRENRRVFCKNEDGLNENGASSVRYNTAYGTDVTVVEIKPNCIEHSM